MPGGVAGERPMKAVPYADERILGYSIIPPLQSRDRFRTLGVAPG